MSWETVGLIASTLGAIQALTQAFRIARKHRDHHALLGISIPAWLFGLTASVMWLTYGISQNNVPLISNNIVWVSCELSVLFFTVRARKLARADTELAYATEEAEPEELND